MSSYDASGFVRPVAVGYDEKGILLRDAEGNLFTMRRVPHAMNEFIRTFLKTADPDDIGPAMAKFGVTQADLDDLLAERDSGYGDRPTRALRRLKDKGYYAATLGELSAKIADRTPVMRISMCDMLSMCGGMFPVSVDPDVAVPMNYPIPDETWMGVIEWYICNFHVPFYGNPKETRQWGIFLDEGYFLIWQVVWLLCLVRFWRGELMTSISIVDGILPALQERCDADDEAESLRKAHERVSAELEKLNTSYAKRVKELDAEILRLRRENRDMAKRLEAMELAVESDDMLCHGSAVDAETDGFDTPSDGAVPDVQFSHELPESGVLFVGGHVNLLNKLKSRHQGWRFLTTRESYSILDDNMQPAFVFMWTKHMSHKLSDKVRDALEGIPKAYVKATNMDLLDFEMKTAYNEHMREHGGDGT